MKKHFLILMLMALLPMAGFAATLDATKIVASNMPYGTTSLVGKVDYSFYVDVDGTTTTDLVVVDYDHFYTSNTGAGEKAVISGTVNNLAAATPGQYFVKVTGAVGHPYEGQTVYVDFWINKRTITITMTADQKKTYGEDDPKAFAYTLKDGEATFANTDNVLGLSVTRKTGEDAGTYAYTATITNTNYSLVRPTSDVAVFTINKKTLTAANAKVYLSEASLTFSGARQAPTVTVKEGNTTLTGEWVCEYFTKDGVEVTDKVDGKTVNAKPINVGSFKIRVKTGEKSNYDLGEASLESGTFTITQAPLNVYVNDLSRAYDGTTDIYGGTLTAKVEPTVSFGGLLGADATKADPFGVDAFDVDYATTTYSANVGTYNLVPVESAALEDNTAYANYKATLAKTGKLTVTEKALTVKADNKEKGLNEDDPDFTITITGAVPGEKDDILDAYKVTREADETIGTKTLTLAKKSDEELGAGKAAAAAAYVSYIKGVLANYNITEQNGTLTIGSGSLLVYPKSVAVTYGTATPTFEVVAVTGNGTVVELTKTPTVKFKDAAYKDKAPTNAGTYELVLDGDAEAAGYSKFTMTSGQYTISPKAVTITLQDQALAKGDKASALDNKKVSITGLVGTDAIDFTLGFNIGAASATDGSIPSDEVSETGALDEDNTSYAKGVKITVAKAGSTNKNGNYDITLANGGYGKLIVGNGAAGEGEEVYATLTFKSEDADFTTIKNNSGTTQNVKLTVGPARNAREIPASTVHTWKAETWNTMVLPFDVTVKALCAAFDDYCVVNRVDADKTKEGNVMFKLEMQKIPANEPFCVKTSTAVDNTKVLNFTGVKIVAPASEYPSVDAGQGYKFVGAYKTKTISKTTPDLYFMRGDIDKFAHIGASSSNTWTVVPFDAYVDQSGSASARELTFTFQELDGSYTAIRSIAADKNDEGAAKTGWYTIGGMKLQSAPAQKGVYIKDGKKVIVK